MHATFRFLACAAAVSISACGGSAGTDDPFAALAAGRVSAAASPPTPSPLSMYDFASGRLQLRSLILVGSSVCYDVILRTVVTAPIRVEITSALASTCGDPGAPVARYDSASLLLSAPKLAVVDTGLCYDVSMRTVQGSPMQLELTSATLTACAITPVASSV